MNELFLALSLISQLSSTAPARTPSEPVPLLSIHAGATLKEVLSAFGGPFQAKESSSYDGATYLQLIYVNDVCSGSSCSVIVENGLVVKFIGVSPKLTL